MDWSKIGLIFFDKLLISLILLAVAFWTKRVLEKSKMTFGFSLKFSEERLRRIGLIWEAMDEWESKLRNFRLTAMDYNNADSSDQKKKSELYTRAVSNLGTAMKKASAVSDSIDKNRFWLGDDSVYQSFVSHFSLLHRHTQESLKETPEGLIEVGRIEEELIESRKSISDYLKLP